MKIISVFVLFYYNYNFYHHYIISNTIFMKSPKTTDFVFTTTVTASTLIATVINSNLFHAVTTGAVIVANT